MASVSIGAAEALLEKQIQQVTSRAPAHIVVLAGPTDSGKTTLLLSLYHSFLGGNVAGYRFAWSDTLIGFERRSHLWRIASGQESPATVHTSETTEPGAYLHLRVESTRDGTPREMLFTDWPGEWFTRAKNSAEECRELTVLRQAGRIAVFLDGAKLVDPSKRFVTQGEAIKFTQRIFDEGMVRLATPIDFVVTKWDIVVQSLGKTEAEARIGQLREELSRRFMSRRSEINLWPTAARPDAAHAQVRRGYGLNSMFKAWASFQRGYPADQDTVSASVEPVRHFDRFSASRMARG